MEEEGKAEASEDARKRASSTRVKTGDCGNPLSRRIAAVSAFKCNMAASLVAEYMWVFSMFGRERSIEAANAPKKGKESKGQRCWWSPRVR